MFSSQWVQAGACPLLLLLACGSAEKPVKAESGETPPLPPITTVTPKPVLKKIDAQYMMPLRMCADAAIKKDAKAAGVYKIEFELAANGSVTVLGIAGSSKELRACMEKHVNAWTFAPLRDKHNKPMAKTLSVPVSFKPHDRRSALVALTADKRMIAVINKKYMAGIHECHKTALKSDPNAVGKVKLNYTVNVDGTITIANVMGISNAALLACIRVKVLTWRLPPPVDAAGKPTTKSVAITIVLAANR